MVHVSKLRMTPESEKYTPSCRIFLQINKPRAANQNLVRGAPEEGKCGFPHTFGRWAPRKWGSREGLCESISIGLALVWHVHLWPRLSICSRCRREGTGGTAKPHLLPNSQTVCMAPRLPPPRTWTPTGGTTDEGCTRPEVLFPEGGFPPRRPRQVSEINAALSQPLPPSRGPPASLLSHRHPHTDSSVPPVAADPRMSPPTTPPRPALRSLTHSSSLQLQKANERRALLHPRRASRKPPVPASCAGRGLGVQFR